MKEKRGQVPGVVLGVLIALAVFAVGGLILFLMKGKGIPLIDRILNALGAG